jgi:hypothetical protein
MAGTRGEARHAEAEPTLITRYQPEPTVFYLRTTIGSLSRSFGNDEHPASDSPGSVWRIAGFILLALLAGSASGMILRSNMVRGSQNSVIGNVATVTSESRSNAEFRTPTPSITVVIAQTDTALPEVTSSTAATTAEATSLAEYLVELPSPRLQLTRVPPTVSPSTTPALASAPTPERIDNWVLKAEATDRSRSESTESAMPNVPGAMPTPDYQRHLVESGESLSTLAERFFGRVDAWPLIYEANRDILTEPNVVIDGIELRIPIVSDE